MSGPRFPLPPSVRPSGFMSFLKDGCNIYRVACSKVARCGVELVIRAANDRDRPDPGPGPGIAFISFHVPGQILVARQATEPGSSLDPLALAEEQTIRKVPGELARGGVKGRLAIIIYHHIYTVRSADCIYFLKPGRMEERGNHDELLAKNGEYVRHFQIQARHYM